MSDDDGRIDVVGSCGKWVIVEIRQPDNSQALDGLRKTIERMADQ